MIRFEKKGVVSIWVGVGEIDKDVDILKDLCGVESYDLDCQEGVVAENRVDLKQLIQQLSYSDSYADDAITASNSLGIKEVSFILIQLDFAYDLANVKKPVSKNPIFLGCFPWDDFE